VHRAGRSVIMKDMKRAARRRNARRLKIRRASYWGGLPKSEKQVVCWFIRQRCVAVGCAEIQGAYSRIRKLSKSVVFCRSVRLFCSRFLDVHET